MVPSIVTAVINNTEAQYIQYLQGNKTNLQEYMYSLGSLVSMGISSKQRYIEMLLCVLSDISLLEKERFIETYELPGDLYKRLGTPVSWPDVLAPSTDYSSLTDEQLLELNRASKLLEVNINRDKTIESGFIYDGNLFQSRQSDRENIMGAAMAASMAISSGAVAGNYNWTGNGTEFVWITADNTLVQMDPYDVLGLYNAGLTFKSTLTFVARGIKNSILAAETIEALDLISCQVLLPV